MIILLMKKLVNNDNLSENCLYLDYNKSNYSRGGL